MIALNISYHLLLVASCTYAWLRGGWEGKCTSIMLLAASVLTTLGIAYLGWLFGQQALTFLIDFVLWLALLRIALTSARFWPLWIVGLHSLSVLTYLAWRINPTALPGVYTAVSAFWSIPILLTLGLGVFLDRRAMRLARLVRHDETQR